jgi:hypothetical protein
MAWSDDGKQVIIVHGGHGLVLVLVLDGCIFFLHFFNKENIVTPLVFF